MALSLTASEMRFREEVRRFFAEDYPPDVIDGSYELNRIGFDNVRVPVANRIGEEGQGWHYGDDRRTSRHP